MHGEVGTDIIRLFFILLPFIQELRFGLYWLIVVLFNELNK